jgi:predicted secreted protein
VPPEDGHQVASHAPTTATLADLPAEVALARIPERLGEVERLREPTTSAAAQSSVRRTSVRFVDSSRPEGPRPEGPCPGEPP